MTTTLELIERTRRHLYSGETRDDRDRLTSAIDADDTTIAVEFGRSGIQAGATLGIDLEELYVWDVGANSATVSRGEGASTAATHVDNSVVYINPKFSAFSILQAINDELNALSAEGLFKVSTVSLSYQAGTDAYDLTSVTDLMDVLEVNFDANDGTGRWLSLDRNEWRLRRDLNTDDFASGKALTVNGFVEAGSEMRVSYKAPYTALATVADNVETISGLHSQAHDILPLGAAIRLTAGAEVSRNFLDQSDTRRADEVPPTARLGQMRALLNLRQQRIDAEKRRLYAKYPVIR